jgi:hypothetical protein
MAPATPSFSMPCMTHAGSMTNMACMMNVMGGAILAPKHANPCLDTRELHKCVFFGFVGMEVNTRVAGGDPCPMYVDSPTQWMSECKI